MSKIIANIIVWGAVLSVFIFVYRSCESAQKETKEANPQDINCRLIINDGQNAKTQAEYDYAARKFDAQCKGWTDPRKK